MRTHTHGLLVLLAGTALIAVMDAIVKLMSQAGLGTLQIAWCRYVTQGLLLFVVLEPRRSLSRLRTKRLPLQLMRTGVLLSANVVFFFALRSLSLADANAIFFSSPLLITVFAGWLLGEAIGVRRWIAVVVGFAGVLLVMRPGSGTIGWAAVLPLIAAVCSALYHVTTPLLARTEDPANTLHFVALFATFGLAPFAVAFWTPVDAMAIVALVAVGVLGTAGHFLLIRAFQTVPASTLSPFLYIYLVWATILGWLLFSDLPSASTTLGALVIIATGLYVYRQPPPAAGEVEPETTSGAADADELPSRISRRTIE